MSITFSKNILKISTKYARIAANVVLPNFVIDPKTLFEILQPNVPIGVDHGQDYEEAFAYLFFRGINFGVRLRGFSKASQQEPKDLVLQDFFHGKDWFLDCVRIEILDEELSFLPKGWYDIYPSSNSGFVQLSSKFTLHRLFGTYPHEIYPAIDTKFEPDEIDLQFFENCWHGTFRTTRVS